MPSVPSDVGVAGEAANLLRQVLSSWTRCHEHEPFTNSAWDVGMNGGRQFIRTKGSGDRYRGVACVDTYTMLDPILEALNLYSWRLLAHPAVI